MKISIAMATYNGDKYIAKQLDSIVNQTRIPDEIVITDDSTNDNTYKIISDYISKYKNIMFRYTKNEQRLGFCQNFFKAIQTTTGDIVFLSDQDDIWDITKIEEMTRCMETNDNIKLLCCKYRCIDQDGNFISKVHEYSTSFRYYLESKISNNKSFKMHYAEVLKILTFPGMAFAIRKEIINDLSRFIDIIDKKYIIFHDVVLAYLASIKNGFYIYNKKLVNYRMHGENAIGINAYNGKGKTDRVQWLDEKIGNQKSIAVYENAYNKNPHIIKYINGLILYNINRQFSLQSKRVLDVIFGSLNYKYMLSHKSYFGDVFYAFRH